MPWGPAARAPTMPDRACRARCSHPGTGRYRDSDCNQQRRDWVGRHPDEVEALFHPAAGTETAAQIRVVVVSAAVDDGNLDSGPAIAAALRRIGTGHRQRRVALGPFAWPFRIRGRPAPPRKPRACRATRPARRALAGSILHGQHAVPQGAERDRSWDLQPALAAATETPRLSASSTPSLASVSKPVGSATSLTNQTPSLVVSTWVATTEGACAGPKHGHDGDERKRPASGCVPPRRLSACARAPAGAGRIRAPRTHLQTFRRAHAPQDTSGCTGMVTSRSTRSD